MSYTAWGKTSDTMHTQQSKQIRRTTETARQHSECRNTFFGRLTESRLNDVGRSPQDRRHEVFELWDGKNLAPNNWTVSRGEAAQSVD